MKKIILGIVMMTSVGASAGEMKTTCSQDCLANVNSIAELSENIGWNKHILKDIAGTMNEAIDGPYIDSINTKMYKNIEAKKTTFLNNCLNP